MYRLYCVEIVHAPDLSIRNFFKMKKIMHLNFLLRNRVFISRGDWGYMKHKIVSGKIKHLCYFWVKTSLKFVLSKNEIGVSFHLAFYIAPFSPNNFFWKKNKSGAILNFFNAVSSKTRVKKLIYKKQYPKKIDIRA
jgi:hypothetical protein